MTTEEKCKECGGVIPTEMDVVHECDLDEVRERERKRIATIWADRAAECPKGSSDEELWLLMARRLLAEK